MVDVNAGTHARLPSLVTAHKIEVDQAKLQERAEWEASKDRLRLLRGERNDTYYRERAAWMRQLLPRLEALNASTRAPIHASAIRCHSHQDIERVRRSKCVHRISGGSRRHRNALGTHGAPPQGPTPSVCSARAFHPSVATFIADFPGNHAWRWCTLVLPAQ